MLFGMRRTPARVRRTLAHQGLPNETQSRVRQGIVANLEYRPNGDVKLYWRNLWNQFEDTAEGQQATSSRRPRRS